MRFSIANCTLIDGLGGPPQEGVTVTVSGDTIEAIARVQDTPPGELHPTYDGRGLTLLPGLIDMHVHMCLDPTTEDRPGDPAEFAAIMTFNATTNLRKALFAGITTVRDVGGGLGVPMLVKKAWHEGRIYGARPFVAGSMITAPGGHGVEMGFGLEVEGPEEVRRAVRHELSAGADLVKLVTFGVNAPTELDLDELRAGVEEARRSGHRVACHAHFSSQSIENTLLAGCDTLEHGSLLDERLVDLMLARRTYSGPTIAVLDNIAATEEYYGGRESKFRRVVKENTGNSRASVRLAHARGVPIIAGTDAGTPGMEFDTLHDELRCLVDLGMSPHEAIRCATSVAAEGLGQPSLGRIAPGARADLLVVAGNPLSDLGVLRSPRAVFVDGKLLVGELPMYNPSQEARDNA
ncbi:MAG TPA: amidohydrolase family protein [Chloroflexia bacterium]|nr:amidohydrolase family protein [Chloroflexia bacterium]